MYISAVFVCTVSHLFLCCVPWLQVLEQADQGPQWYRSQKQARPADIMLKSCSSKINQVEGAITDVQTGFTSLEMNLMTGSATV